MTEWQWLLVALYAGGACGVFLIVVTSEIDYGDDEVDATWVGMTFVVALAWPLIMLVKVSDVTRDWVRMRSAKRRQSEADPAVRLWRKDASLSDHHRGRGA
jgi:hypothetical protein